MIWGGAVDHEWAVGTAVWKERAPQILRRYPEGEMSFALEGALWRIYWEILGGPEAELRAMGIQGGVAK